jgi:hypothetical protein
MTCRCCCRMPADGSRKKDYRAGPCKMAPARDPSGGLKHNVAGHSGSKLHRLHRLHGLHRVHLSNSPAPPSASLPLRPSAPTPPSTQSRTRSGGFDVPPASSQASLKRVFHASPGAAHVWARWKLPHSGPVRTVVNSRELHGMLPRSTRDKAGGRRTRHCSEWRGEGREVDGEGEGGEEGVPFKEGQAQRATTRPSSIPGAAALQRTQSAHSAPTLINDQDPILVLVLYWIIMLTRLRQSGRRHASCS